MASDITYSAEFVVEIDKLKKGVVESQASLQKLEGKLRKGVGVAGKEAFEGIGNEADKAKVKIDGLGKEVKKSNNENIKSGETFFSAFKKGWKDSTDTAGGEAVKMGKMVGSMINPLSIAMTALTVATGFLVKKIKDAYDNWKKHNENVKKAKDLYAALNGELSESAKYEDNIKAELDKINFSRDVEFKTLYGQEQIYENLYQSTKASGEAISYELEQYHRIYETSKEQFDLRTQQMKQEKEAQLRRESANQSAAKATDELSSGMEEYEKNLKIAAEQHEQELIDNLGYHENILSNEEQLLERLIEQRVLLGDVNIYNREHIGLLEDQMKKAKERMKDEREVVEKLREKVGVEKIQTKELTKQEKIDLARAKAEEKYLETKEQISAELYDEILTEKEAAAARDAAMATWKNDLQAIVDEYNLTEGETVKILNEKRGIVGETEKQKRLEEEVKKLAEANRDLEEDTLDIKEQIDKQEIDRLKALADVTETEEEKNSLNEKALQLELKLLDKQREREKQAYMESDAFKLLYENNKEGAEEWEKAFDQATVGMKAALVGFKEELKFDFGKLASSISQGLGYFQDAASSVLSITQSMAEDQIDTINNLLEQQKEIIDAQYEEAMEQLEKERQAALEAAGFVQTTTEEGLAASMEAALASGDEAVIYKEKRRQEELAINKEYDDLLAAAEKKKLNDTKAAEKKAARDIAEIQYQQAMAEWSIKLAMAPGQIAAAILATLDKGGAFAIPLTAIVSALGALQIAAIIAAMPKKPAFAGGGVIGLPQTYSGGYANGGIVEANTPRGVDPVDITAANREMILNDSQQSNLFNAISSGQIGGGGAQTVIVQLVVDGSIWAERMVDLINDGATSPIQERMIAR